MYEVKFYVRNRFYITENVTFSLPVEQTTFLKVVSEILGGIFTNCTVLCVNFGLSGLCKFSYYLEAIFVGDYRIKYYNIEKTNIPASNHFQKQDLK